MIPLVVPQVACAQSYELDELLGMDIQSLSNIKVEVGSKRLETISQSPAIISVVTQQDIESYGGKSLMDVIARLPNVDINVVSLTPTGIGPNSRGQTPSGATNRTLLLFDGRPFRESQIGAWNIPFYHSFPLEMIERIEVIRGPGSALYGTNAFSSTINVIAKKPEGKGLEGAHISSGYGSYKTYKNFGSYGYYNEELDASLSFAINSVNSDGWRYKLVDITGRYDEAKQGQDYRSYYARGKYKNLTLGSYYGKSKVSALGVVPIWPVGAMTVEREFVDVGYTHPLGSHWEASFNVTYNGFSNYATDGNMRIDENNFHDILYEASLAGKVSDKLNLVLGTTFDDRNGALKIGGTHFDESILGHYVQADYRLSEWFKVFGGTQFNKPEKEEAYDLSPRLGTIVNFTDHVGAKVLYGEAFRAPTGAEVSLNIPGVKGSADLKSEKVRTKELELFYSNATQYYSLTAYRSDIQNSIILVSEAGGLVYRNRGHQEYKGIEFEGKASITDNLSMQGSLTYQKGKDLQSNNRDISNAPHLMLKLGGRYNYKDALTFGAFNTYYADTVGYAASTGKPNPELKNSNLLTLNTNININKILGLPNSSPEMSFNIYADNLLDQKIYTRVTTAGLNANTIPINSGRALYANFSVKF